MKRTAPLPSDQAIRERFATELERNFSVIAPAGVGKTATIVDRVIAIATQDRARALEWLPKLVVVTYTNRAADEMQQRARNRILERKVDLAVLGAFNRAFFGTIHSFCLKLLQRHGYHLGLPGQVGLVEDEDALWLEFVRQLDDVGGELSASTRHRLFRHVSMLEVIELARRIKPGLVDVPADEPWLALDFAAVLSCPPNNRSKGSVERGQQVLREWITALEGDAAFLPLPSFEKGGAEFQKCWGEAFTPLRRWLGERALTVAHDVAVKFREYRVNQGQLTYDDQLALAAELTRHPDAGKEIRSEQCRVILDEAQDTDPLQFEVLQAVGVGAGHFSMVGDPQQSIYGERADLEHYRKVHRQLTDAGDGEELTFDVTFRCDRAVVDSVNNLAPAMLTGAEGQVNFVELRVRPEATAGQVARCIVTRPNDFPKDTPDRKLAWAEAEQLAKWLKNAGLRKLRAADWSEVAILCPRKRWFGSLRDALTKAGIPVQVQSHQDVNGDSAAYAWFTALLVVATEPHNSFEIVGVLREVFGLSDQSLADFSNGDGTRFQIEGETEERGDMAETLSLLARTRIEAVTLPLRDGILKLVKAIRLRERLLTLDDGKDFATELDDLLVRTAVAEADGLSLVEWADKLRREFENVREGEPVRKGAVQLITCQKAKGLQWHAVVLPFLFRKLKGRSKEYPLVVEGATGRALAAFESADISDEDSGKLRQRTEQEYQRVLYVAMTRAKRTLVVVDDSALFESKPDAKEKSFAQLLGITDGSNGETWKKLSSELSAETTTGSETAETVRGIKEELPAITTDKIGEAIERAGRFLLRVLPHKLAKRWTAEEPEARGDSEEKLPAATERSPAVRYGIWWHDRMKNVDWRSEPDRWTRVLLASDAPKYYRDRAEKEWAQFLKSDLAKRLSDQRLVVHAEMPVLWKRQDGSCVEGFIDLAAFDPELNEWLIVDWKTDLVKTDSTDKFMEEYAGQLQAYAAALGEVSDVPAKGSLYLTSTGTWIRIS